MGEKLTVFGELGVDFDEETLGQIETAMALPNALAGALLPDAHLGYALPIGGVVSLDNSISPSYVGYDIACRMTMSILDIDIDDFMESREALLKDMRAVSRFGVGAHFQQKDFREHAVMDDPIWDEMPLLAELKSLAQSQLGSSGGGNHFFDAVVGEVLAENEIIPWRKPGDKFVAIMTHSGSRGTGYKLAKHYVQLAVAETGCESVPRGYEWLPMDRDSGREYWGVMQLMGRYAQANHHLIHEHFSMRANIPIEATVENHHNFAWDTGDGFIHRKGATPAAMGQVGIVPGSSGTASYLVTGLGNKGSLFSSSHGAGRTMSRTQAKREFDADAFIRHMAEADILFSGIGADEGFGAYKDIERVMDLQSGKLVVPIARMWPKIVVMGGKSDDGD